MSAEREKHRWGIPAEIPHASADEFAAAVIEAVLDSPESGESDGVMTTPEEARRHIPGGASGEDADFALMNHLWSHETRTMIVISKAGQPLPYWQVKKKLHRFERAGERAGWYPYGPPGS